MKRIAAAVLTFIFIILNIIPVKGEAVGLKSKNYNFEKDTNINGVLGNYTFFFDVDKTWDVKDCYLNLVMSQSDLLDATNSTLTLMINNVPVYTMHLSEKEKYKDILKVPIPLDKVNSGYNEVKIKTYRRITEKPCTDSMNEGNWIVYHKESFVHLDFSYKQTSNELKDFPYPYGRTGEDNPAKGIIMLSDSFKDREASAAMMLSSVLGNYFKFYNLNLGIYKFSEATEKASTDIMYIGSPDNSPKEILDKVSNDDLNSLKDNALIKQIISPYNPKNKMLIIMSNDEESLLKAVSVLSKTNTVMELDGSSVLINKNFKIAENNKTNKENLSLKDLNYDSVLMQGPFTQQTSFNINLSKNKSLKEGAKFSLKSRYSKNLYFEKSLVTVYINDIPIGSKKLTSNDADNDSVDFNIPKELRNITSYELKVVFNLYVKDEYCNFKEDNTPWAYILNNSSLYLPSEDKEDALFEYYSNPFISNGSYNDLALILSDNPSSKELTTAGNIMAFLGHDIENFKNINVVKASDWSKYKNKNIITIGTGDRNSFIKNLNKNLYIKFKNDFKSFESNEDIPLIEPYSSKLGSLQLIDSPYKKSKNIFVVTGTNENYLSTASKYIFDFELLKNLKGNGVTIDNEGHVKYAYFGDKYKKVKDNEDKTSILKNITMSTKVKYFVIITTSTLLILITASVFIIRKYKKN